MIAERWGVDERTVRNLISSRELKGFPAGRKQWRVRRERLEEYELCLEASGDLLGSKENGASHGTSQTEPVEDTNLEPKVEPKQKRKPRLDTPSSPALKVVS